MAFTINAGYTTASCLVSINGILQVPVTAYAVAGTTLTFTEAPALGDLIEVREIVTTVAVKGITNANGSAVIEVSDSNDYIQTTGNIIPSGNVLYNLGSPSALWNELYLSGNSIYIGDVILKAGAGNLQVRNFDDTADAGITGTFYTTSTTSGNLQIGFNLGKSSEITRDEVNFQKFIDKLRKKFSAVFLELLRTQLLLKNVITEEDWDELKEHIRVDFRKDNFFSELKDAEILSERINQLNAISPYVGKYFSEKWVRRHVLRQTDEDIDEMAEEMGEEADAAAQQMMENPQMDTGAGVEDISANETFDRSA